MRGGYEQPVISETSDSSLIKNRNYGIDLLRIISMIMIPILHVLGHGGILENSVKLSVRYELSWFLEIACYCAVNSYALISGFVQYGRKQKYSNIIYLYFQVLFYTILATAMFAFWKPEMVGFKTIIKAVFPFAYNTYWYFTAYFCLVFFIPSLNLILDKFEKEQVQKLLLAFFVIFSLLQTFFHADFGVTRWGYSFLWLAILYLTGAYIKKYGLFLFDSNVKNLAGYFICVLITWISKICIELLTKKIFHEPKGGGYLISYVSPTFVFSSIFLLIFFSNIKCGNALIKFIRFFSPVTFGVYLFHEEPLIRETFIKNAFINYLSFNSVVLIFSVVLTGIAIWFVGSLVDKMRYFIFKLLRIKELSIFFDNKISGCLAGIFKKIL